MQLTEPIREAENCIFNLNDCTYMEKRKKKEGVLTLSGWLFYKEEPDSYEIRCSLLDAELLTERSARPDVAAAFPERSIKGQTGFKVTVSFDLNDTQQEICFYACRPDGSQAENLFTVQSDEAIKYQKQDLIHYTVDRMVCRNGHVELNGWAYAEDFEEGYLPVEAALYDGCGKPVEHNYAVLGRPDVTRLLMNDRECDDAWGFHIDWNYDSEEQCFAVRFTQGTIAEELKIDIAAELRKERERKRRFADTKALRKARDRQMKQDDRFYKEHLSEEEFEALMAKRLDNKNVDYDVWREANLPTEKDLKKQRKTHFAKEPKISIVVPAYRTPEKFLREMIDSVRKQTYGNWELCIADGSLDGSITGVLEEYAGKDSRVRYVTLEDNFGISGNTNGALELATGDYISLLDHDDVITEDALFEVVKCINETGADVLYSDEDKVTADLIDYFEPHFKPDFNPDLLYSTNYICHYFVVKREILEKAGKFGTKYDGSQDYDFILRCTSIAKRIAHIPKVLYHWRTHSQSTAANPGQKMYCYDAGKQAVVDALTRKGEHVEIASTNHYGYYRLTYLVQGSPLVSVLTREENRPFLEKNAGYDQLEILYQKDGETYRTMAERAEGEYLLILDALADEVTDPDWIKIMLGNCQRKEVVAVGGQIYGDDRRIISSGIVMQGDGSLRDLFLGLDRDDPSYTARGIVQQDVTAVSMACMMMKKENFLSAADKAGKQDTAQMVRICMEAAKDGGYVVYLPQVQLHTSFSGEKAVYEKINADGKGCGYNPVFDPAGASFTLKL